MTDPRIAVFIQKGRLRKDDPGRLIMMSLNEEAALLLISSLSSQMANKRGAYPYTKSYYGLGTVELKGGGWCFMAPVVDFEAWEERERQDQEAREYLAWEKERGIA
jgi:hypothetical protein